MATLLRTVAANGNTIETRVSEDPTTIAATLAVASKEQQPFVVFTNVETGKEESFDPTRVLNFASE